MTLLGLTQAASTKRRGAITGIKPGAFATHLTNLLITPVMLQSAEGTHAIRQLIGLEGDASQIFVAYSESHTHTDGGVSVTQVPDITAGDELIVGSSTYVVKWAEEQAATSSFGATLILYLVLPKRL